jgi:lipoprotein Spr
MIKRVLLYPVFVFLLGSCSALKTAFTGKKTPETTPSSTTEEKKETLFLDQVFTPPSSADTTEKDVWAVGKKKETRSADLVFIPASPANEAEKDVWKPVKKKETDLSVEDAAENVSEIEKATPLQLKYALLLQTNVEEVKNTRMYKFIDDWYGARYRMGGTTRRGVDCSAFSQILFASVYSINLPRTARDQYRNTNRISRTELKEGDLLFFNTRGGVSHVGVYLQNNKFVHASTSNGVMISDMFESYWVRRLVGVGRIKSQEVALSSQ